MLPMSAFNLSTVRFLTLHVKFLTILQSSEITLCKRFAKNITEYWRTGYCAWLL